MKVRLVHRLGKKVLGRSLAGQYGRRLLPPGVKDERSDTVRVRQKEALESLQKAWRSSRGG